MKKSLVFFAFIGSILAQQVLAETAVRGEDLLLNLAGIYVPENLRAEAVRELAEKERAGVLRFEETETDLYGAVRGIAREGALSLQEEWLARGIAFVFGARADLCEAWLVREEEARKAKRGLWAAADAVLPVARAKEKIGQYAFLRGEVTYVREREDSTVLYLGAEGQDDLALVVPRGMGRALHKKGIVMKDAKGTRLLVRGLVEDYDVPSVRVNTPCAVSVVP